MHSVCQEIILALSSSQQIYGSLNVQGKLKYNEKYEIQKVQSCTPSHKIVFISHNVLCVQYKFNQALRSSCPCIINTYNNWYKLGHHHQPLSQSLKVEESHRGYLRSLVPIFTKTPICGLVLGLCIMCSQVAPAGLFLYHKTLYWFKEFMCLILSISLCVILSSFQFSLCYMFTFLYGKYQNVG